VWPRVVVRFVASVALVSGVLLLVDAAVTLAWQEPLSALVASRGQDRLDDELAARFAEEREAPDRGGNRRIRAKRMAGSLRRGDALGRIVLPTLGRRYAIAEGTDSGTLRAAPGHYPATGLPGEGTTVAVAGHRTTYGAPFRTIDDLPRRRGDRRDAVRALHLQGVRDADRPAGRDVGRPAGQARAARADCVPPALQRA
jgi:sortase A